MEDRLKKALDEYYKSFPEDKEIPFWSGCNYYINQGNNAAEPVGSATSMHDCMGCEKIEFCTVKQSTRIFQFNREVEKELENNWKDMHR